MTNFSKVFALSFFVFAINLSSLAQLSGTYTIGSGQDFETISKAVDSLNLKGITSSVEFKIKKGTYFERFTINNFPGESATDTVVFVSEDRHPDSVKIEIDATSSITNYILKLNGCERVTFKDVSFITTGQNYSIIVDVTNGASHNRIENCLLSSPVTANGGDSLTVIFDRGSGEKENNNQYLGNIIEGGWIGISINGEANNHGEGTLIIDNKFSDQENSSIAMIFHNYGEVIGNTISGSSSTAVVIDADSTFVFERNYIKSAFGSGVWFNGHVDAGGTGDLIIANNMIITPNGYAARVFHCTGFEFVHNSLYSENTATNYTLDLLSNAEGYIQNNIIVNNASFGIIQSLNPGSNVSIDHNAYYTPDGSFGNNSSGLVSSFSSWQSGTGTPDLNSEHIEPFFKNNGSDLRLQCSNSHKLQTNNYISVSTSDMDGNVRPQIGLWKGATELRLPKDHIVSLNGYVTDGGLDTIKHVMLELYGDTSKSKKKLDFLGAISANPTDGYYEFLYVPYSSKYWIKVIPNKTQEPDFVTAYHNGELRWDDGTPIVMTDSCVSHSEDVFSRKYGTIAPGTAKIKGNVTETGGTNKTLGTDPIAGLDVILDRIPPTKNTVATTVTDASGNYEFGGLSDGIYVVTIEIEGLPADTIYEVEITDETSVVDLNYCVDTTEAIHGCSPEITGAEENDFAFGKMFPNPIEDNLNLAPQNSNSYNVSIASINGQVIYSKLAVSGMLEINTANWESGVYFVSVNSGNNVTVEKIVKK